LEESLYFSKKSGRFRARFKAVPRVDYEKLVSFMFSIPHVRYASIADEMGQRIVGGMKPGVKSATAPEEEARLALQSVVSLKSAEGYEKYTGKLRYLCINWDRMFAVFFLLPNSKSLAITVDKTGSQPDVIRDAIMAIEKSIPRSAARTKRSAS
jgi:hypothetical protein